MRRCMSLSLLAAASLVFLAFFSCTARAEVDGEKEYQDFRAGLIELYTAGKYDEVAKLVEENYDRFPGKATNMSFNMALVCKHLEDYDKGIEYLSMAHERGQWFSIYAFQGDFWEPYREKGRFNAFLARNLEMKDELRALDLIKLKDTHIVKIVDFVPKDASELNKVIIEVSLDSNEVAKILEVTGKY